MSELPPFWLAYLSDPSDSGRIHSNIRQRWLSGTPPHGPLHTHRIVSVNKIPAQFFAFVVNTRYTCSCTCGN